MRIRLYSIVVFVAAFLAGCSDENQRLNPTYEDLNWYVIHDGSDEIQHLRYQIYSTTGISVFHSDTIGREFRGVNGYGDSVFHYEVLAPYYSITSNTNTIVYSRVLSDQAIRDGLCRSVHDLSEGGLAVAAAEMSFAGGLGVHLDIARMIECPDRNPAVRLFSESNTRFLIEVEPGSAEVFEEGFADLPYARLGVVTADRMVVLCDDRSVLIRDTLDALKESWKRPLSG